MNKNLTAKEALAESWASIDGKTPIYGNEPEKMTYPNGDLVTKSRMADYRDGYEIESKEMIERLKKRGYAVVHVEPTPNMIKAGYTHLGLGGPQEIWQDMIKVAEGE